MEKNPLSRALRPDKVTVATLEATLRLYQDLDKAARDIPLLSMLLKENAELKNAASHLYRQLRKIPLTTVQMEEGLSEVGGGALPEVKLPTWLLTIKSDRLSAQQLSQQLRRGDPAILSYIRDGKVVFDMRTIFAEELDQLIGQLVPILS